MIVSGRPRQQRRKKSDLWNYFTPSPHAEGLAVCNLCGRECSHKTTMTNLKHHLKGKHPEITVKSLWGRYSNNDGMDVSQDGNSSVAYTVFDGNDSFVISTTPPSKKHVPNILASAPVTASPAGLATPTQAPSARPPPATPSTPRTTVAQQKKIERALMKLFYKEYQPLSLVTSSAFVEYTTFLNPGYKIPTEEQLIKTLVPSQYDICMRDMKRRVKAASKACLTTDCWSSANGENYISVTAHFVGEHIDMEHVMLDCTGIEEGCTSEDLAGKIMKVIIEWGIEEKVLLVVTNDADGIRETITNEMKLPHFPCYAHTLNSVVLSALELVQSVIDKAKSMASIFLANPIEMKRLAMTPDAEPLVLETDGRWTSTFYMLRRFVELEGPVSAATEDAEAPMTSEDWKVCRDLVEILKPFEEVAGQMGSEGFVPGSQVIVLTQGLVAVCNELKTMAFQPSIIDVVTQLEEGLKLKLPNIEFSDPLSFSTFLDPRFKLMAFTEDGATQNIVEQVHAILSSSASTSQSPQPSLSTPSPGLSALARFKAKVTAARPAGSATSSATAELQRYLDEPILDLNENPLQWWKDRQTIFPHLTKMAKEKMCVVATCIPGEAMFSDTGLDIADRRSRLPADRIKKLVFLNANYKS